MRYATLAILLLSGLFGMSAPVIEASPTCVVTVDVTGDTPIYDTQSSFNVTATVGGTTGNYAFNIQVRIEGFVVSSKNYIGSGSSISKTVQTAGWNTFDAGNEIEFRVTVSGVVDSLFQDIQ